MLPVLIARAVDRALSRCAEDDPPRVVALRVGWAVLRELERAGVRERSPRTIAVADSDTDSDTARIRPRRA